MFIIFVQLETTHRTRAGRKAPPEIEVFPWGTVDDQATCDRITSGLALLIPEVRRERWKTTTRTLVVHEVDHLTSLADAALVPMLRPILERMRP